MNTPPLPPSRPPVAPLRFPPGDAFAWASRPADAHKGSFGTLLVVGGSVGEAPMLGAPALCARAGFRAGVGLVRVLAPGALLPGVLTLCPSATGLALPVDGAGVGVPHACVAVLDDALSRASAVVVGPGMGVSQATTALALRAVQQQRAPVVLDADALTALAHVPELTRDLRAPTVLTPHPGEFARLAEPLGIAHSATQPAQRALAAQELAQRLGCVVVLKGAATIVADALRTWQSPHHQPALATAGTGDVLAGLLGGLLAQHAAHHARAQARGASSITQDNDDDAPIDLHALARQRLSERASPLAHAAPSPASPPHSPHSRPAPAGAALFELACLAVDAHARAAQLWCAGHSARAGLMALELADLIPESLEAARG